MHILFLPSWYPATPDDPFGSFFREQALAMRDAGCEVGVIAPHLVSLTRPLQSLVIAGRTRFELDKGMPTFRRAVLNLTPRIWRANTWRIASTGWRLYLAYRERYGRPDVVHVHSSIMCGVVAQHIRERDDVPFFVSEHGSAFAREQVPPAGKAIARRSAVESSGAFAVSSPFCRILESTLALPEGSYCRMPNMVDASFLDTPLYDATSESGRRFLHVSMLDANKNVGLILDAFAIAFADDPQTALIIGGDGPERSALIAQADRLGVAGRIHFPGRLTREQVRQEMALADAFLLSSNYETFGVVLIEAMAMGLPVVATACGGPQDIVTPQTGVLVRTGEAGAFANAMQAVAGSRDRWSAHTIRAHCRAEFGPKAVSTRWMDIYRYAMEESGQAS